MKYFFASLFFILLLNSCATKSAFSKFDMDKEQELTASVLQSSKITSPEGLQGVISAVYLNEIYPDRFKNNENFYLYFYLKNDKSDFKIKLNGVSSTSVKKLPFDNEFSHLVLTDNDWNKYYLVEFDEQVFEKDDNETEAAFALRSKRLNLTLESGDANATLYFKKN